MLSLKTAQELKEMGLDWSPSVNDFFAMPDRDLEDKIFVVGDLLATIEVLFGKKVVSFQGAPEWALDSILVSEVVWIPSESQLRQLMENYLSGDDRNWLSLTRSGQGVYRLRFEFIGEICEFEANKAEEVYALGLLYFLQQKRYSFRKNGGDS